MGRLAACGHFKGQAYQLGRQAASVVADHKVHLGGVGKGRLVLALGIDDEIHLFAEVRQLHPKILVKLDDGLGFAHRPLNDQIFGIGRHEGRGNRPVAADKLGVDMPARINFSRGHELQATALERPHRS